MWTLIWFPDCTRVLWVWWLLLTCAFSALHSMDVIFLLLCDQIRLQWAILIHCIPFYFPSVLPCPAVPRCVLSTFSSLFLQLLWVLITFTISHLSSLIVLHIPQISPLVFPSPPLFSVSVEPLWLHRYSDCRLCRGGGMLFRHSVRRYCTTCTLTHMIKSPAACSKTFINITSAYKHDLWPGWLTLIILLLK